MPSRRDMTELYAAPGLPAPISTTYTQKSTARLRAFMLDELFRTTNIRLEARDDGWDYVLDTVCETIIALLIVVVRN